jgi:uncharacterized protein (DUF1015 family)
MAIIAPFKGITYNFDSGQDPASLVAPPYDVISEEQQDKYYQADPHNVTRLVLGKKGLGILIGTTAIQEPPTILPGGSPTAP